MLITDPDMVPEMLMKELRSVFSVPVKLELGKKPESFISVKCTPKKYPEGFKLDMKVVGSVVEVYKVEQLGDVEDQPSTLF